MTASRVSPYLPSFIGGATCLDFVNTVDPRHADEHDDCLRGYPQLLRWAAEAGLLTAEERSRLERRGRQEPGPADAVHQRAVELREALYRLFAAQPSAQGDLARLTDEVHRAWAMTKLARTDGGWAWRWDAPAELDRVLWPVARSAAELLTSGQLSRVRDRKSTRLNSSHVEISYAVFCLKKKNNITNFIRFLKKIMKIN